MTCSIFILPTPACLCANMWFWSLLLVVNLNNAWASVSTTPAPADRCDLSGLEYRLMKLEVLVNEKYEAARAQIDDATGRLQRIERQTYAVQNNVQECKSQVRRFADGAQTHQRHNYRNAAPDAKLESILKTEQLSLVALRLLSTELGEIGKNVSDLSRALGKQPKPASTAKNCRELENKPSGIYLVHPPNSPKPLMVFCDMESKGGGWLVIQNRFEGSQDFYLGWDDYKTGFGNLAGEFWLGLEHVHHLTGNQVNELLIELVDVNKIKTYAHYGVFGVGSEEEGYSLKVLGAYEGDAGDSLSYHAGNKFSTKDKDQDGWPEGNCAQSHRGAWWYRGCDTSNLNGAYVPGDVPDANTYQGMYWRDFRGPQHSLLQARMMIRPRDAESAPLSLGGTVNL